MNVRFYKFSKRENSTLQPGSGYTTYNCILKGSSSMTQAALALDLGITEAPEYNYAYIPDWNRYYFVSNWTWAERLWNCTLAEDYLATWKSAITSTSAFVLYDTTANTELTDSRLSMNTTYTASQASGSFSFLGLSSLQGNVIIVTITGKETTAAYALNRSQVKSLLNNMSNWLDSSMPMPEYDPYDEMWEYKMLQRSIDSNVRNFRQLIATGTATDNIRSAFQLPFAMGNVPGENTRIFLGEYETAMTGKAISDNRTITDTATVSIPWQASDWRRNAPYTEIFLYNPFTGLIQLSNSDLIGVNSLTINAIIDMLTGDTIFEVLAAGKCINQTYSNLAAAYPIGASNITPANVTSNIINAGLAAFGAAVSGNLAGAAVSGINGIFNAATPSSTCITGGGGGASLGLSGTVRCYTIFHDTSDAPGDVASVMGTPTMERKSLSGLSGYVQTAGASVSGLMLDEERITLNNMLDTGIFIE